MMRMTTTAPVPAAPPFTPRWNIPHIMMITSIVLPHHPLCSYWYYYSYWFWFWCSFYRYFLSLEWSWRVRTICGKKNTSQTNASLPSAGHHLFIDQTGVRFGIWWEKFQVNLQMWKDASDIRWCVLITWVLKITVFETRIVVCSDFVLFSQLLYSSPNGFLIQLWQEKKSAATGIQKGASGGGEGASSVGQTWVSEVGEEQRKMRVSLMTNQIKNREKLN